MTSRNFFIGLTRSKGIPRGIAWPILLRRSTKRLLNI
jgi:hypothetical protein